MCLIILRNPNKVLSFEDFTTSINNNPHGYGLCTPSGDGKKLTVLRSASQPDPDELYRLIQEEFEDRPIMLHLRYNTAGTTSLRNAHPFPILDHRDDGEDMRMAHNGTILTWKNKKIRHDWESDTRVFSRGFVRPLFKRFAKGMYGDAILEDEFIMGLLQAQIPSSSVLTFMDAEGNFGVVNAEGNGGGWDSSEEVYFSNSYSFNKKHRSSGRSYAWEDDYDEYFGYGVKKKTTMGPPNGSRFKWGDRVKAPGLDKEGTVVAFSEQGTWVEILFADNTKVSYLASALQPVTREVEKWDVVKHKKDGKVYLVEFAGQANLTVSSGDLWFTAPISEFEKYEEPEEETAEPISEEEGLENLLDGLDLEGVAELSNSTIKRLTEHNAEAFVVKLVTVAFEESDDPSFLVTSLVDTLSELLYNKKLAEMDMLNDKKVLVN